MSSIHTFHYQKVLKNSSSRFQFNFIYLLLACTTIGSVYLYMEKKINSGNGEFAGIPNSRLASKFTMAADSVNMIGFGVGFGNTPFNAGTS
jgi:hypothetical protein